MAAAGAAALLGFLALELRAFVRGEPVAPLGVAIVVITDLLWSALLVGIAHPLLPLYALASGHYVQHLYFVWRFEHREGALGIVPAGIRERIAPRRPLFYLAALGALGAFVVLGLTFLTVGARAALGAIGLGPAGYALPPWTAAMIGVNLSHYWLDHRVWRLRRREVARPLDLLGASA
jgi:hypothetical protein